MPASNRGAVDPDVEPREPAIAVVPDLEARRALEIATTAIKVGDFASAAEADAAAARLEGEVRTVDHRAAPFVVRPGAWAVVIRVRADPTADLAALRTRFPEWSDRSWVVPYRW